MMKNVHPYINHGRWIVDCPKHGKAGAVEVTEKDTEYIAPCCYPQIIAAFPALKYGQIKNIPDRSARATARMMAEQAGEVYTIVFPKTSASILEVMNRRPVHNRHWTGETLKELREENKAHGVK